MTDHHLSSFMPQLVNAATQLASRLPSFACRVLAYRESVPGGLCGSYVSVSGGRSQHIVGLLSLPLGWESLGRALDHDLPRAEARGLIEGACEIGKIVAEAFKNASQETADCTVGLPLFVEGMVSSGRSSELQAADIVLGNSLILLVLFSRSYEGRPVLRSSTPCGGGSREAG
jgi:hypothetical protein